MLSIVIAALVFLIRVQLQTHLLDLTAPVPDDHRVGAGGSSCATGLSGELDVSLPLRVSFAIDRSAYVLGDRAIIDVEFTNNGREPVRLPWARPESLFGQERDIEMDVSLTSADNVSRVRTIGAAIVKGNIGKPGTVLSLRPGEMAHYRLPLQLTDFSSARNGLVDLRGTREVRARILISTGHCQWAAPIVTEPVSITLSCTPERAQAGGC